MNSIPLVVRATLNATGAITFTGNTLGLSRSEVAGVPGTSDSIGAFITTNSAAQYGTYPLGTTSNYLENSSAAILVLPTGSTVLYAELIWGGTYVNGTVNLSAAINNPVTFRTPLNTFSVTPDAATSNTFDLGGGALGYVRSANVTAFVQAGGAGTYSTGSVVGTIIIPGDSTANHAGWTLAVIYQNPSLPFRNMSLRAGAILVQSASGPVNTTITGFATPISGALGGRALFSAQEGDANRTGDQALFGPTAASLVALSGTNNFANNFFASQINNDSGALNTTGTFGNRNQTNGAPGTNIIGGRQGWDITNVDVSARLTNNQSSAVLSLTTSGDAYVLNANAIQVDINAPIISVVLSDNVTGPTIGDIITYTVTVSNSGTANAASVVLTDTLSSNVSFVAGSVTVGGVAKPTFDIRTGAPLGSLNLANSITVTYQVVVTSLPSSAQISSTANAAFTFQSVAGGSVITGVIPSNTVTVPVFAPNLSIVKSANTQNATVGDQVTYTMLVANTGSSAATLTLTDNIPAGTSFIANSFRVNGVVVAGANPAAGVAIGSVAAGGSSTVTFQVQVNSLPSPPQLVNQASATYTYQIPDGRIFPGSLVSNTVTIPVRLPSVTAVKTANLTDIAVGETLTYTIVVTNSGIAAVTNVTLTDAIPAGAEFVSGSVVVAGASRPTASPASGISIGTIAPSGSVTVTFAIRALSVPSSGSFVNQASVSYSSGAFSGLSLSGIVTTPVYQPIISIVKSGLPTSATVGGPVTYSFTVRNTGNIAAQATLTDNIPNGSSFIAGSVTVNGTARPSDSPVTGISLGSIPSSGSSTVSFKIILNTLPSPPTLVNQAVASYTYLLPSGRALAGSSSSNTVTLSAQAPNVSISKSANATAAAIGDIITFTLAVTNNSIVSVTNVNISDSLPNGTTFVAGSTTINGVPTAANPNVGIAVGTLNASAVITIVFQVQVTSLPSPAVIANVAGVSYTSGAFTGSSLSNTINIPAFQPVIGLVKSASTQSATEGDTYTYTIRASNTGNTTANVTITDNIPAGATFAANSVLINAVPFPGLSPVTGIPIGALQPGTTTEISFVVTVTSLPSPQVLVNQAVSQYNYSLPDGRQLNGASTSNTVSIPVSPPNVTIVKSLTTTAVVVGDTFAYTSVVTNNGIAPVNNVVINDPLSGNIAFINNSVIVNGTPRADSNPSSGIPIGTLAPGGSATVTFEVRVTMAVPSQITNQSTVSFTSGVFSASSSSNMTTTPVTQPQIALLLSANTSNATVGDTVTYTVLVSNAGNLAGQLTLSDPLPLGTTFAPNSVVVGGVPHPGESPVTGISVGSVPPGASIPVTYSVIVTSLPNPQFLVNQAFASYTFTPPDGRLLSGSAQSNTLSISVSAPNVAVVKSTTAVDAALGEIITYSVGVTNSGIEPINNVVLTDPVPDGAAFVAGSVTVNGTPVPGVPAGGIPLGTIAPSSTVTVTFKLSVIAIPASGQIGNQASVTFTSGAFSGMTTSNVVNTPVYQPIISLVKSANTINATLGDTVSYRIDVSNTGNYAGSVVLTDNIPAGAIFQPNSVLVGGLPQPGTDPVTGITINSVAPNTTVTVIFSVIIDSLPNPQQLSNQAAAAFSFVLPSGRPLSGSASSNTVVISVSAPNVSVVKSTASTAAAVGDIVTYSISILNSGIAAVNNVIFTDPLPVGTALVAGSVLVDGAARPAANPAAGVAIGTIAQGQTVVVSFNVTVTSLPASGQLSNRSSVSFTSGVFSGVTFSNTVIVPVYQPILTGIKTGSTSNATIGDTIVYTIAVQNAGNYPGNVTVTDTIPAGTSLVQNSVIVNGQLVPGADPAAGISLGSVTTAATVTFSVVINTLPPTQQLANQASATYSFTLPDTRTLNGSFVTNTLSIPVSAPNVVVVKSTTVIDAVVGDTLTYRLSVTNSGIENINNVRVIDQIPAGAAFQTGSVVVDGVPVPSADPTLGILLGTIAPGITILVDFSILVTSLPSPASLSNAGTVSFTSGAFSGNTFSNTVVTPVYQPQISLGKSADTANATVGDTVTYSLTIKNTGNIAADASVLDTIPTGAAFVPNSVLVNGVPQPGANPATGVSVGTVQPGASVSVLITLQVTVDALPSPQLLVNQATANYSYSPPDGRLLTGTVLSNVLSIPVSSPNVTVVKSASSVDAVVGDTITYTMLVTNNGIAAVSNVVLIDPVPAGTTFTAGSVIVNGISRPSANPNNGITIGTIAPGASSTVTFQVLVVSI
ncbi:DUF11 domain-containing protein [Bacillus sp. FJAT-26390]|uniref:DUF7507 domain-containing protein n=1 Tax=Bacillus sp. FJAT-26390 TaxID=1743142 RepID=UPI000807DEFD|nr:DUF11 domain-containing protein [Bacillus sp. FJAT-26390]OBZ13120.1 hypothetical protein A7975_09535 [Bacillus sp. FJAT-26390]